MIGNRDKIFITVNDVERVGYSNNILCAKFM